MAENKKSASGWGGRRKGSGAKRTLPPGARTRSVKMTDEEYENVKNTLNVIRREKKMISLFLLTGSVTLKRKARTLVEYVLSHSREEFLNFYTIIILL
jgi:hypothetical protein